jgi:P27 family predicted phage terminase small subunit
MGPEEGVVWDEICKPLMEVGVLTALDWMSLGMLCQMVVRYRKVSEKLAQLGEVIPVKNNNGDTVSYRKSPFAQIQMDLAEQIRKYAGDFGMSPSGRSRIMARSNAGEDSREAYFDAPRRVQNTA